MSPMSPTSSRSAKALRGFSSRNSRIGLFSHPRLVPPEVFRASHCLPSPSQGSRLSSAGPLGQGTGPQDGPAASPINIHLLRPRPSGGPLFHEVAKARLFWCLLVLTLSAIQISCFSGEKGSGVPGGRGVTPRTGSLGFGIFSQLPSLLPRRVPGARASPACSRTPFPLQ